MTTVDREPGSDELLYSNPKVDDASVAQPIIAEQVSDEEEERRLASFRDSDSPTDEPGVTHTATDRPPPADEEHPEFEELPDLV